MYEKKIAIVGYGFVGKAVSYGFNHPKVIQQYIDPKLGTEIMDIDEDTDFIFVCVPTPMDDFSIVREVMEELLSNDFSATIILKSTVPPVVMDEFDHPQVIYNPEFLTEKSAEEQFIDPQFHVFGASDLEYGALEDVEDLYNQYSLCNPCPVFKMSIIEASIVKYTINSFLATKVTFFNQVYNACKEYDANFSSIIQAVGTDKRVGHGHTKVPGFDGKLGFGGACFPKDTKAFVNSMNPGTLSLIEKVTEINNELRSKYDLDEREKEQNIVYFPKDL